jgi:hypothetical protein
MRAKTFGYCNYARIILPYLWGFAAAAALDYVIDVQMLFLPVMAGVAVVSAGFVVLRRRGR